MTIAQKIAELAEALGVDIPNDGQIADNLNAITLAKGGTITSNTNISEAIKNLANTIGGNDDESDSVSMNGLHVDGFNEDGEAYALFITTDIINTGRTVSVSYSLNDNTYNASGVYKNVYGDISTVAFVYDGKNVDINSSSTVTINYTIMNGDQKTVQFEKEVVDASNLIIKFNPVIDGE